MFFSKVSLAKKYNYLEEKFLKAYQWLEETDIMALENGTVHSIDGEQVYAQIHGYTTRPAEEKYFETHDKFFDVQYVAAGKEAFGMCSREGLIEKERIAAKDLVFYEEPEECGYVLLKAGDMIVLAPEDAHKPGCAAGEGCEVKKVVIKVAV